MECLNANVVQIIMEPTLEETQMCWWNFAKELPSFQRRSFTPIGASFLMKYRSDDPQHYVSNSASMGKCKRMLYWLPKDQPYLLPLLSQLFYTSNFTQVYNVLLGSLRFITAYDNRLNVYIPYSNSPNTLKEFVHIVLVEVQKLTKI